MVRPNGQAIIWNNAPSRWEPEPYPCPTPELGDPTDVNVTTVAPKNDYALSWNAANNEWRPVPLNNVDAATVTTVADAGAFNPILNSSGATAANGLALRTDAGILYNPKH